MTVSSNHLFVRFFWLVKATQETTSHFVHAVVGVMDGVYKEGGGTWTIVRQQFPRKEGAHSQEGNKTKDNAAWRWIRTEEES